MQNQKFQALSRICLNNWHYIDKRVLSFAEGINFFTGHSGSGKSTVIDAMQILLYANTDGRGFFNKAAADDSDRTLIEYLRGMVNIGEDNQFSYLRNKNFSSTIVMELGRTDTGEYQSIGVAFDVESATNEISRLFFWHKGPILESAYRTGGRAMSIEELKEYLNSHYGREEHYFGPSNERFRRQLYDVYLGGLNMERFPLLFKRAIPFRMNIKLEEFVKEYICLEEDIHIEDMQESVMQYGRMRKRIGDTCSEIRELIAIREAFDAVTEKEKKRNQAAYFMNAMELRRMRQKASELKDRITACQEDRAQQEDRKNELDRGIADLEEKIRELIRKIAASGYEDLKVQLKSVNEMIERLNNSKSRWQKTAQALRDWEEQEVTPNEVLWNIERFQKSSITEEQLAGLKRGLAAVREDVREQKREADGAIREYSRQEQEIAEELKELRQGRKAYPRELEEARQYIRQGLKEQWGKHVPVEILADLLDIRDDTWRNAVEGYLGGNKLLLIVEPKYARAAMELYQELDKQKYHRVAVLDTEKVMEAPREVAEDALAEEVVTQIPHARAYIDFLLGNVIKCADVDELRACRIGITPGCILYHSFKLQYINPDLYTRRAYIGEVSMRRRIRQLEDLKEEMEKKRAPHAKLSRECAQILDLDYLKNDLEDYLAWMRDIKELPGKERKKERLRAELEKLQRQDIGAWEEEQKAAEELFDRRKAVRDDLLKRISDMEKDIHDYQNQLTRHLQELTQKEGEFTRDTVLEEEVSRYLGARENPNYERLQASFLGKANTAFQEVEEAMGKLREIRYAYLRKYPNRTFSPEDRDNKAYDELLSHLQYSDLEQLHQKADEQAKDAVNLFKRDFIYKIRSAIREAFERRDELNKIISRLDFGKDRYQFVITRNRGPDGKYYDMFMDENLEVNPSQISDHMENQMNLFTMSHEDKYGEKMNELISIFIPPDNASAQELEEAKHNMEKYADYRTYLSFDMQQIIEGEETIRIRLSRMIKKNSGGEGQNPLYVALLASFAQAYRINVTPKLQRNPTIRLVVLDEAFSKMDAEKVASCIELIRGLGFQAIISATNDKIQNYLENVDKTFVFANPNKKHISILEFEKTEFGQLTEELEESEAD